MLIGEGENVQTVAKLTLYHPNWVYELVKQFCTKTFEEFVKETRGGNNHRNLSDEQEIKILNKFKEKAEKGQVINLSEIKNEYEEIRGKETANSTFYNFLDRMGWRRVMPRGEHPFSKTAQMHKIVVRLVINVWFFGMKELLQ